MSYSEWSETRRCFIVVAFRFRVEYAISKVQENGEGLILNGAFQLMICADNINVLGETEKIW